MARLWIGTSGWSYRDWVGPFYPKGLASSKWFGHYCEHFRTVELNVTFYRIPTVKAVENWVKSSPEGFVFAIKMFRGITHIKKLRHAEALLDEFFDVAAHFGPKLEVILIQLPPSLKYEAARTREFFEALREKKAPYRYVVECRHPSWFQDDFFDLLRQYGISLCVADWGGPFPAHETLTAPFLYVRFHGPAARYASLYSEEDMATAGRKIHEWLERGLDVYVYFNNDTHGYAIENARKLMEFLWVPTG